MVKYVVSRLDDNGIGATEVVRIEHQSLIQMISGMELKEGTSAYEARLKIDQDVLEQVTDGEYKKGD